MKPASVPPRRVVRFASAGRVLLVAWLGACAEVAPGAPVLQEQHDSSSDVARDSYELEAEAARDAGAGEETRGEPAIDGPSDDDRPDGVSGDSMNERVVSDGGGTDRVVDDASHPSDGGPSDGGTPQEGGSVGPCVSDSECPSARPHCNLSDGICYAVRTVLVMPDGHAFPAGREVQFTAYATFGDFTYWEITQRALWKVAYGTGTATVRDGFVLGRALGTVTINATYGGITGVASATITAPTLSTIDVETGSVRVEAGAMVSFTARGRYSDGSTADLPAAQVAWSVADSAVAKVDPATGIATALRPGVTSIRAQASNIIGAARLTVTDTPLVSIELRSFFRSYAAGVRDSWEAIGHYGDGSTYELTYQAVWSSSVPTVADVEAGGDGNLNTFRAGTTDISARVGAIIGTASLVVTGPSLLSTAITPENATVREGERVRFAASGAFDDRSTRDLTHVVRWSSSNRPAATMDPGALAGEATGITAGVTTISARIGPFSASTPLVVTRPPVTLQRDAP